jgi:Ras-related C3 botulinum toxin substrate 1
MTTQAVKLQELAEWASAQKWADYIDDDEVQSLLTKLKSRIDQWGGAGEGVRIKLVAVGDGAVGKTSLLIAFAKGTFPESYIPTVFENYTAEMPGDTPIHLHLWDTAGQEDYDRLRPLSYPGADVVLLCFSLVTESSLDSVKDKWQPEVEHYISECPTLLVGTKVDLRDEKIADVSTGEFAPVSDEKALKFATDMGCSAFVAVSAKTGKNLKAVFEKACSIVQAQRKVAQGETVVPEKHDVDGTVNITVTKKQNTKKREGCVML